jgi:hypothetical protein
METAKLKKFAQFARRSLLEQVSTKLKLVLDDNSSARRESAEAIKKLEEAIKDHGKEQVIDRVAYTWFNRFCALRYMDVNRVNRISVVSPLDGTVPARDPRRGQDGAYRRGDGATAKPAGQGARAARRHSTQPRSAAGSLPPAGGGRLQLLATRPCRSCSSASPTTPNC